MIDLKKKMFAFIVVGLLFLITIFAAINLGSIEVTFRELLRGLFIEYNENVAVIYDLRFPRIIMAILGGAALAVSGVLFQSVMKNPLAEPSIIGISSGASLVAMLVPMFFPSFYFITPVFAFIGGIIAWCLVYSLSYKEGLSPLRLILVGVAVSSVFTGIMEAMGSMMGSSVSGAAAIVNANITMKTWEDVHMLVGYVSIGLVLALCMCRACNLMALEDKTARNLGVNIERMRLIISMIAVLLASSCAAIVGVIAFLGLIVPHIGRLLVGSDHKWLIPFSMLLGSFMLLLADTAGRVIAAPYEISASVLMAIVGGPFFIVLLRKGGKSYGN